MENGNCQVASFHIKVCFGETVLCVCAHCWIHLLQDVCISFYCAFGCAELNGSQIVWAKMRDLISKAHEAWSRGLGCVVGAWVAMSIGYACYILPHCAMNPCCNVAGRRRRMSPILAMIFLLITF